MASARTRADVEHAPLRVRAYIHEDFRKGLADPEGRVQQTVADAGAVLWAQLGVGLDLVDLRPWPGEVGSDLGVALGMLERLDPASDIDIVAGFIGELPLLTYQLHSLGTARILGQHVVMRGSNDAAETRAIDAGLTRMSETERSELIVSRRRHKSAAVLLHEVAHALGGVHVDDPEALLFPTYSVKQSFLNDDALALLAQGLAFHRARDDSMRAVAAAKLREEMEARRGRFDDNSVEAALAALPQPKVTDEGDVVLAKQQPPRAEEAVGMTKEQADAFNAALASWQRGDVTAAWTGARALARAADAHPRSLLLACALAGVDGVVAMDGPSLCERAVRANQPPAAGALEVAVAAVRLAVRNKTDAAPAFAVARARLDGAKADDLVQLASLARATDRLALAEAVLAGVDDERARTILGEVTTVRRRTGLPAGRLAVEDEAAFAQALRDVYDALERDAAPARENGTKLLDAAEARFGDVSGLAAARCDLLRRSRKLKDAEKACAQALELMPDASFAHVILALVHLEKGRHAKAIELLEKATALDPAHEPTRRLLEQVRARR